MAFSILKNVVNGLSGKTAKKATAAATAASQDATTKNNALAADIYSKNTATLAPFVAQGGAATSYINQLLGLSQPGQNVDGTAANNAFDAYKQSTGYASRLAEGNRAVTNNAAVSGLLNSGSTLKALTKYGQDQASQEFGNYYNQIAGQQGVGLSAASAQAGVANNYSGQVQNNNSVNATNVGNAALARSASSDALTSGILKAAGAAAASDRRLKSDIVRVGTRDDGLGVYQWRYVWGGPRFEGVMADEVATLRPDALGPVVGGYATVDYDALGAV